MTAPPSPPTLGSWVLTEVAPCVWTRRVEFCQASTTVVVPPSGGALVVDPAFTAAEIEDLVGQIATRGWRVVAGVSTHAHYDHVLWSPRWDGAARWASADTVELARKEPEAVLPEDVLVRTGHDRGVLRGLSPLPRDAARIPWPGPEARVLSHDAHARGHVGLFLPEPRVLIAGDMLSGRETPLLDVDAASPASVADPIRAYRHGLDLLAAPIEAGQVDVVIPGHGLPLGVEEARAVIDADRAYLDALESGRRIEDSRLRDPWVRDQHEAQATALRG